MFWEAVSNITLNHIVIENNEMISFISTRCSFEEYENYESICVELLTDIMNEYEAFIQEKGYVIKKWKEAFITNEVGEEIIVNSIEKLKEKDRFNSCILITCMKQIDDKQYFVSTGDRIVHFYLPYAKKEYQDKDIEVIYYPSRAGYHWSLSLLKKDLQDVSKHSYKEDMGYEMYELE